MTFFEFLFGLGAIVATAGGWWFLYLFCETAMDVLVFVTKNCYKALAEWVSPIWAKYVALKKPPYLPLRSFGGEVLYTWEDWDRDNKEEFPIRYFLSETLPDYWRAWIARPIGAAVYWVASHTTERRHILDLRNPGYKYGWVDADAAILYANFNLLKKFMEEEKPWERINWQVTDHHSEAWSEINELYSWWTKSRWEQHQKLEALYEASYDKIQAEKDVLFSEANALEAELVERDTQNLIRLINVRGYLWT